MPPPPPSRAFPVLTAIPVGSFCLPLKLPEMGSFRDLWGLVSSPQRDDFQMYPRCFVSPAVCSFFTAEWYSAVRTHQFGYFADGPLGVFQFGAIVSEASMNIQFQSSTCLGEQVRPCASINTNQGLEPLGCGAGTFRFVRNYKTVFRRSYMTDFIHIITPICFFGKSGREVILLFWIKVIYCVSNKM